MLQVLTMLAIASALHTSSAYLHLPERGPFDELSSDEIHNAFKNLATFLGSSCADGYFFLPRGTNSSSVPLYSRTRAVYVALEVPSKHRRVGGQFTRLARVALYTPGSGLVQEYLVGATQINATVTKARRVPALKRPVDEVETRALDHFLHQVCGGEFGQFLRMYYGATFMYKESNQSGLPDCMKSAGGQSGQHTTPSSFHSCLFGMFASPRVTSQRPNRRISVFRLNRFVLPYNQHPTDIHIEIDHTDDEQSLWSVIGLSIQGHRFGSIDEFLSVKSRWSSLFARKIISKNPFADSHTRLLSGLCPRARPSGSSTSSFSGTIVSKHVSYGPWQFDVAVRHETGLRFYNVYFNHQLMMHEAGLDETVTIYGGETPFMRALTSLESMFSVGSLTSELSPGIDCPVDAVFLTVPIIISPSAGASTVHNGICIYASAADVHEGALRRYVHPHGEDPTQPDPGYATGTVKKALYVVTQAAIFNYHYAFVNIFSPSGTYASYVVPSGYIHVDVPDSIDHLFGYVSPGLDLRFNIHTHRFLFFVDALGVNNTVEQTRVYAEGTKSGLDRMSMQVTKVQTEREGQFQGGDPTTSLSLCLAGAASTVNSQCLQIVNTAPVPSMVSQNSSRSFAWIRRSLWFTRYKENELRASSIYNGVDLTDPVVDFSTFSTDEALDEDVVMWVNVGFIHIPGNEDIPHTPSKGSQLGLILRPQNFFPQTPDGPTNAGYVFTTDVSVFLILRL
ncbi:unnamed protein product [Taenia asiatica]|uniref:Amine oxidase n=1 Tax=Taenia asiatica TaxID=60517 RepID=A0A0R3WCA2_TAEAS|nr:unnamed protein product [Taenia asiatica]